MDGKLNEMGFVEGEEKREKGGLDCWVLRKV